MKKTRLFAIILVMATVLCTVLVTAFSAAGTDGRSSEIAADGGWLVLDTEFVGYEISAEKRIGGKVSSTDTTPTGADSISTNQPSWVKTGGFNSVSIKDYYGTYQPDIAANMSVREDGEGDAAIVWSSWSGALTSDKMYLKSNGKYQGDDNNCVDVRPIDDSVAYGTDEANKIIGKDYTFVTSIKAPSGNFADGSAFSLATVYTNHATSQISFNPVYILDDLTIAIGSKSGAKVGKISATEYTDIAVNVRIIAPTSVGEYNAADFSGAEALSAEELAAKYGQVVYDVYVNGILVSQNNRALSAESQARIAKNVRGSENNTPTGLSTDYRTAYIRILNFGGNAKTAEEYGNDSYEGKELFRLDSVKMYYSPVCYVADTVQGYSLTINGGTLGLNCYLKLTDEVIKDADSKVRFTTPRGEVRDIAVSSVTPEDNGFYKFTVNVSSVEMAKNVKLELLSGSRAYPIYKDGGSALYHEYSVKDYAEKLLGDVVYGGIVKAMLNYGAYAQVYFGFDTDNLPNTACAYTGELSAGFEDISNVTIAPVGSVPSGIKATLVLDANLSIIIYNNQGIKLGEKSGISSFDLDTEYTVALEGGSSVKLSVLAVGEKVLASGVKAEYKNLVKALKLFSDASLPFLNDPEGEGILHRAKLDALKASNAEFTQSQFGEPKSMGTSPYAAPKNTPTVGEHPRVFLTKQDIPRINALLENPEYAAVAEGFWRLANEEGFTGVFKDSIKNGVTIRWNTHYFEVVEAKALAYLLTGDELYAYEAIVAIKNMMLTLKYDAVIHSDTYHGADEVITHASMVYDMCYDVMTDSDRDQFIGGICNLMWPQMEFKFPPSNLSAVSGHGTGSQFLRTYVAVALTVCDEMPDWWQFVGGRYYEEYLPVINYCYQSGYVSQGSSNYGDLKLQVNFLSAFYVRNATGEMPLVDGGRLAPYYMLGHVMPNDKYLLTGDGPRNGSGNTVTPHYIMLGAKLFNDPTLAAWGKYFTNNYTTGYAHRYSRTISYSNVLIWLSGAPTPVDDPRETTELIEYLPYPGGNLTARNSWDADAAMVFMRVGELTMSNHDLYDSGTFQIYYKGLLACSAGSYSHYGSNHHKYFLQGTVGQNGLLIYNPALGTDTPVYGKTTDGEGNEVDNPLDVKNASTYFYSGGQDRKDGASTYDQWLSGEFDMATVVAVDEKYESGKAKMAYISGDLTNTYNSATVSYVGRRMLAVYTGDEEYPMLYFTFDTMTSTDASFRKSFLLHTVKEPTVDKTNMTASIVNGEGRLNLVSVYGPDIIEKIGGEGYAYWISGSTFYNEDGTLNGKNCVDTYVTQDNYSTIWGRVELVKEGGNLTDNFLTAMYVTDASNTETLAVEKFHEGKVWGAKIKNIITAFVECESAVYNEFSFTTSGEGTHEYYISGVESGTWTVYVNGTKLSDIKVGEGSDLLSFTAGTGTVRIVPGEDVAGVSGGKIEYETYGGTLPEGAPTSYNGASATPLPTSVTRGKDAFLGWYTSPDFKESERLSAIPAGQSGTVKLYAKYSTVYFELDYDNATTDVDVQEANKTADGVIYTGSGKASSSFIIKTDEKGEKYLEWKKGEKDPNMSITNSSKNFSHMTTSSDETVSFTMTFARDGSNPVTTIEFRIMSNKNKSTDSYTGKLCFAHVLANGEIRLASTTGPLVTTLGEGEKVTVRIAVDFKNAKVIAYTAAGAAIASADLTVPSNSTATTLSEFRTHCDSYLLYPYSTGKDSTASRVIRIYDIRIEEGNVFAKNS